MVLLQGCSCLVKHVIGVQYIKKLQGMGDWGFGINMRKFFDLYDIQGLHSDYKTSVM